MAKKLFYKYNDLKNIMASRKRRDGPYDMSSSHSHPTYELYYLLDGDRNYFINNKTYHITSGTMVLIRPFQLHKTFNAKCMEHDRILIEIKEEFFKQQGIEGKVDLSEFLNEDYVLRLELEEQQYMERLLFKLLRELGNKDDGFEVIANNTVLEILIVLMRIRHKNEREIPIGSEQENRKIEPVIEHIVTNYMKDINLDSLAHEFFISKFYLCKIFKKITGFTINEYLNSVRIKNAQKLILRGEYNFTEISEIVGYESITHFGRMFKKYTGLSPSQFKKKNKGE